MTAALDRLTLVELQAALLAGAGAGEAVAATCGEGLLASVAHETRLGRPLSQIAGAVDTGDPAADFLVRCLALAERTGGGGAEAVAHALGAIREEAALHRLLAVRTAQARGTARVLAGVPLAAWLLLVALDTRMLAFYATGAGLGSGMLAIGLAGLAWWWMRRLTARTASAAAGADPLAPPSPPPAWRRGVAAGALTGLVLGAAAGPGPGLLGGAVALLVAARRRTPDPPAGGGAETISLLAVALETGMGSSVAVTEVAAVAPEPAAALLRSAARRSAGGWPVAETLADTPLAPVGATLAAAHRWGAPAAPALRALADDVRADRRAAVEVAAERLQLALIFPTTLLTLPAFVIGVVPPLLWATVRG